MTLIVFFFKFKQKEMGQTLSEPITDKDTSSGSDTRLAFGASGMQGWRISKTFVISKISHGRRTHDAFTAQNKF